MQTLGAKNVPQCSLCQQPCRMMRILHVGHRHRGVAHAVVHDGVHADGDGVFGQDLAMTKVSRVAIDKSRDGSRSENLGAGK